MVAACPTAANRAERRRAGSGGTLAGVPEILEVESYRRAAEAVVGRRVAAVDATDAWFLKRGLTPDHLVAALVGERVTAARRRGKLLLLDTDGPVLGLRFGMTGRLVVDGVAPIDELLYSSRRDDPGWDRVAFCFEEGGTLRVNDPRRLGGVELDPDEDDLGVDALGITEGQLAAALAGSRAPLKARLLDQARVAGVGNLLADEALWRAGLDPARAAGSLDRAEVRRLHRALRRTLDVLGRRGGSHLGDLQDARAPGGRCPRDGTPLVRRTVGGRTTYSCPVHQR
jgi:formamidopyrimidine-DNA glycosylase